MENFRALNTAAVALVVGVVMAPQFVYAYKINTHEVLTDAAVALAEEELGDVFSERDARAIVKGSREEDDGTRPLQHFFDPVNNRGLSILKSWPSAKQWASAILAQGNYCDFGWCPKRIGKNDALFSSPTDYSWERAVYEYAHGDKERGLEALGHVLHLVQDASVPAHVRNDQHLNHQGFGDSDPYEEFAGDVIGVKGENGLNGRKGIKGQNGTKGGNWRNGLNGGDARMVRVNSVEEAIGAIAEFANKHFVSKDTLFEIYDAPSLGALDVRGGFAWDSELRHKVARVELSKERSGKVRKDVFIDDSKNSVASDYWRLLSKESVAYSAGVIDLFLREVEKEKQTHALLHKNRSYNDVKAFANRFKVRSGLQVALSSLSSADRYELNEEEMAGYHKAAEIYGIDVPPTARTSVLKDPQPTTRAQSANALTAAESITNQGGEDQNRLTSVIGLPVNEPEPASSEEEAEEGGEELIPEEGEQEEEVAEEPEQGDNTAEDNTSEEDAENEDNTEEDTENTQEETQEPKEEESETLSYDPDSLVGSGGSARVTGDSNSSSNNNNNNDAPEEPSVASPDDQAVFGATSVNANGTTTAGFLVTAEYGTSTATTTANGSGEWDFSFPLDEGTTTLSFFITDGNGDDSSKVTREILIDTTAPTAPTSVAVDECDYSLASGSCVIATTTATVSWSAISDANYYGVTVDGSEVATTTATSTATTLSDGVTSEIAVVSYDAAENSATSTDTSVEVALQPIVINEVAWAGTDASASDEWMELYNRTSQTIFLDDMQIAAADGVPQIELSGTLAADDYYLVERTASTTTTVDEDLVVSFSGSGGGSGLSNSGEELLLLHTHGTGTTTIDRTPAVVTCSGWCAGFNTTDVSYTVFPAATTSARITMERTDASANGATANSWQNNDGYTKQNSGDADGDDIYGTPGRANSEGYPEAGFFCGSDDVVEEGDTYTPPSSSCTFLSGFITGGSSGVKRWGGIYEGTVGSSTAKWGANSFGKAAERNETISPDIMGWDAGSYFYAVFENRTFGSDVSDFDAYFTGSASSTPHGNFRVVNWTLSP